MSLFGNLISGALKSVLEGQSNLLPGLLTQILGKTDFGSVAGLLTHLQQAGLGNEVASWLSNGQNLPTSVDQLRSAVGSDGLQQIARSAGMPVDNLLAMLSQQLPQTVDSMSPNGALEENTSLQDQAGLNDIRA